MTLTRRLFIWRPPTSDNRRWVLLATDPECPSHQEET